jgi:chromosome segregation ATPase
VRHVIIAVAALLVLVACGDNEEKIAAKRQEYKNLEARYKAVNLEYSEKHPERQKVLDAVIPAKGALTRAKRSQDEAEIAAAQQAFDEAAAAAEDVIAAEGELKKRIRALKDEMAAVEQALERLGSKP